MTKTKRKTKRTSKLQAPSIPNDGPSCLPEPADDSLVSKGILPVELTHSIIAQALGNYYADIILYEGNNITENGEPDVPFTLLHVSKLFRSEAIRLMGYLFAGSREIVDVRNGIVRLKTYYTWLHRLRHLHFVAHNYPFSTFNSLSNSYESHDNTDEPTNGLGLFDLWQNFLDNTALERQLLTEQCKVSVPLSRPIEMEDIRRAWMGVVVEERIVKSVEGIPGFVRRVGEEGGTGVGLWAVLVGRIVRASRLKGLKFLKMVMVKGIVMIVERIINGVRAGTMNDLSCTLPAISLDRQRRKYDSTSIQNVSYVFPGMVMSDVSDLGELELFVTGFTAVMVELQILGADGDAFHLKMSERCRRWLGTLFSEEERLRRGLGDQTREEAI